MLSAFFVTTTAAIVVVIFAYGFEALDDTSVNYFDKKVISMARGTWYRVLRGRERRQSSLVSLGLDLSFTSQMRKEAVVQFLLALSDQQLVTGLAILIAGVSHYKDFTRYEWVC